MSEDPRTSKVVAEPLKLKELVTYQSGAIVSRTLVSERNGTVTAFAFDEGQGLSEHTAPYDAMVIALEGEANIKISSKGFHLKEGEMIVMPANKPHSVEATTRFKMILIMIRAG